MRLALWAGSFAVGVACAVLGAPRPLALVVTGGVAVAIFIVAGARARTLGGVAIAFAVGSVLGARAAVPRPLAPAVADAVRGDAAVGIVARVARGPEWAGRGARLVLDLERVDGAPADGVLALAVLAGWPDFGPGERVSFSATLHEIRGTRNPGLPDPALGTRAAGIDVVGGVPTPASITRLAEPPAGGPRRAAFRARRAMRAAIDAAVSGAPGAFLKTAVLGDRRGVGEDVEEGFSAAGATHVLSVSGLHLAAVVAVVFLVARVVVGLVPGLALYVDPRAVAAAVSLPVLVFFTLLTGEAVATQRSAVMLAIGMGGIIMGRPVSAAPAIAAAALVILIAGPLRLFDESLQLSLASVSGIALLASRLGPARRARGAAPVDRASRWLWRFVAATIAATAFTAPLVAHDFGELAPASPLGNLALVPLVELGVVPLGLFGGALAALGAPFGRLGLRGAGLAARLALAVAAAFRAHAPVVTCRLPNALETGALMAAAAASLWAVRARGAARRAALVVGVVAAGLGGGGLFARDWARRHDPALRVTFLDVGQGDAAVVEAPGGVVALVDGGGTFDDGFDPGERIVEPFLRARGITRVDLVALSHPHPDHLNGLRRVLRRFPVGALWTSGDDGHNPEYGHLLALARAGGVPTPVPADAPLGAARLTPLGPFVYSATAAREVIAPPPGLSVNDASLVLRLSFAGRAVLFAGDLEADGEGELVGRRAVGQDVAADVLKVPHHGSRTSSSAELIDAVRPTLAVMSLGWRNRFHFPAAEVVARYAARGADVLRTDRDGAVTITIARDGRVGVACERGCPARDVRFATDAR
ncbi:MAG TPA: ComEC/Rec2 family competence protein [Polyangia bacterium]|nr:ComEC/Rec2 family competence protein [Polyangia bacterium]